MRKIRCGLSSTCEGSLTKAVASRAFVRASGQRPARSAVAALLALAVRAGGRPRRAPARPTSARCRRRSTPPRAKPARSPAELRAAQDELAAAAGRSRRGRAPARNSSPACSPKARSARPSCAAEVERSAARLARREGAPAPRPRRRSPQRLVAIYESGAPSTASVILGSGDFDELADPQPTTWRRSRNPTAALAAPGRAGPRRGPRRAASGSPR